MTPSHLTYHERAKFCLSVVGKQLLELMDHKKTNLALSADVTSAADLLEIADKLGPEICILKTHIDIIEDFTPSLTHQLVELAQQHHFLIFEDRKFADIGHTVKHQYGGGIYRIADWAEMTNAHCLPGPGIIQGLWESGRKKNRGLILLAEMSSAGHLMTPDYMANALKMAEEFPEFVFGFITQRALSESPHWINLTPGVKLETKMDDLGQQYVTPEKAIIERGTDIIIVGRGILKASNPLEEARHYRQRGWQAYLVRIRT
jgi:uridine monophosphate synthetase